MSEAGPRRKLVENELLEQAAALFAERGFDGTTMQDVANYVGLSRAAIYYYIKSKDDLLERLVAELTQPSVKVLRDIRTDEALGPIQKLHAASRQMALWASEHPARLRLLERNEWKLSPNVAERHQEAKREALQEVSKIIQLGEESGALRAVDPRRAAFFIIGACNWVAWWIRPGDKPDTEEIADDFAEMAVRALIDDNPDDAPTALHSAISRLRNDVNHLERLIGNG